MNKEFLNNLIKSLPLAYAYHKLVLNSAGEAEDYIFLDANAAFEKMTGLKVDTIIGKKVSEVLPGVRTGDFDWVAFYGEVALTGVTREITQYADMLDRWYKITVYSPEREHFVTIFQDITSEVKNNEVLVKQKQEIETLLKDMEIIFNSTQDAMALVAYEGGEFRYIRNNAVHHDISGFSLQDIQGKNPVEVLGKDIGEQLQSNYQKCVLSGKPITYELVFHFPVGDRVWLTSLTPVFENQKVKYLVSSSKDVTDLKNVQREKDDLFQRLHSMFDKHMAAMLIIEPLSGKIEDANPAACDFYGYTRDELLGMYIQDINVLPKEEVERLRLLALKKNQKYFVFPHRLKNGEIKMVDVYSCPIIHGRKTELFSIIFDVTDREKLRDDLYREKEFLSITLNSIGDGVVTTDTEGMITALNGSAEDITGWDEEEAKNRPFTKVFKLRNETTGKVVEDPVAKVLHTGKVVGLANHTVIINKSGNPVPIADSAAPIRGEKGQTFGVVMVFRDVSKDKEQQEQILYLSYHDALTGLYNRRFIDEEMKRLDIAHQLPLSVIMGDVNGLKLTNDVFGHEAGDSLLQKVAETLKENCREQDIVARWGGDEFLILLPHTTAETAENIIQNIKNDCSRKSEGTLQLSVALGCAVKKKKESLRHVLQEAEERMYHQKLLEGKSYRNSIVNTLLATLYEKSSETEEHDERIKNFCHNVGLELKLSTEKLNELSLLAMLHDIGKVGINQSILQRTGALTPDEWEEMKRHPEIGYRIAQYTPELSVVAKYILSHHEHWDGTGYPRGLKGENIPLLCRVLAVADAYDAMTNDRVYRKALSKEDAIAELKRNAGTQFDPVLVNTFLKTILCC